MSLALWYFLVAILVLKMAALTSQLRSLRIDEESHGVGVKVETFLSPKFELEPGSVCNKFFHGVDFPKGHIALKSFDAELVDEDGNSVPLQETYVHHWIVGRYLVPDDNGDAETQQPSLNLLVRNSGVCNELIQYFGLGSETRKTDTRVPDPYGIEVGNPDEGFEERWLINVHAIDTRGAEDKLGCIECRCSLYNVSTDSDYPGGIKCCKDGAKCRVKQGFRGEKRGLYLKYTVTYADWNPSIVPVEIYIFDVTDTLKSFMGRHNCRLEYQVEACSGSKNNEQEEEECVDSKSLTLSLPKGGDLIYAVAHQHTAGIGSTLFGEDGRVLCGSFPIYGNGTEPGNEDGYIVGMSTCYPQPGSVKIAPMEKLTIVSNYSNVQMHYGVMGYFYILLAEPLPQSDLM